jgi:hypothetical protein
MLSGLQRHRPASRGPKPAPRPSDADLREDVQRARRRLLRALLGLAFAVGAVLLIERAAGYRGVLTHLREANADWLLIALVAEAASFAGYIWALRRSSSASSGGGRLLRAL